jgi:hypothetical protein
MRKKSWKKKRRRAATRDVTTPFTGQTWNAVRSLKGHDWVMAIVLCQSMISLGKADHFHHGEVVPLFVFLLRFSSARERFRVSWKLTSEVSFHTSASLGVAQEGGPLRGRHGNPEAEVLCSLSRCLHQSMVSVLRSCLRLQLTCAKCQMSNVEKVRVRHI